MHNIQLKIYIWDGVSLDRSDNWMIASKEMSLPFVPFVALQIDFPMEKSRKIEGVGWSVDGGYFTCTLEAQYCDLGIDDPVFDEWAETFEENGWHLLGPYPKNT